MLRVTMPASIASPSGILSLSMIARTRSPAKMRISVVVQAQVEAARARIALATGTAAQLVVDAAALVPLGRDDAQAAGFLTCSWRRFQRARADSIAGAGAGLRRRGPDADGCQLLLEVAAEHDVGAAAGHVGRDRDAPGRPACRMTIGLARMLFGVEHLVRQAFLLQQLGDDLGVLDRRGADQHRLARARTP